MQSDLREAVIVVLDAVLGPTVDRGWVADRILDLLPPGDAPAVGASHLAASNAVKDLERWFRLFQPGIANAAWCDEMRESVAVLKSFVGEGAGSPKGSPGGAV